MNSAASLRPCIESAAELEGRDTTLRCALECGDVLRREVHAHHLVEIGDRLVGREPQVDRTDLGKLAPCPQAGQRESGIGSRGDHQVDVRRQVFQQERDPFVDLLRVDEVVDVKDEDRLGRRRG